MLGGLGERGEGVWVLELGQGRLLKGEGSGLSLKSWRAGRAGGPRLEPALARPPLSGGEEEASCGFLSREFIFREPGDWG